MQREQPLRQAIPDAGAGSSVNGIHAFPMRLFQPDVGLEGVCRLHCRVESSLSTDEFRYGLEKVILHQ